MILRILFLSKPFINLAFTISSFESLYSVLMLFVQFPYEWIQVDACLLCNYFHSPYFNSTSFDSNGISFEYLINIGFLLFSNPILISCSSSFRNPEEGVRRLAFGMVLYGRRPAIGSSSDRPPGV